MDNLTEEYIGLFVCTDEVSLDFSKYNKYRAVATFTNSVEYGTSAFIYSYTSEFSLLTITSADGLLGANFSVRDNKIQLYHQDRVFIASSANLLGYVEPSFNVPSGSPIQNLIKYKLYGYKV